MPREKVRREHMKSELDYWIEVDRQKERALKRLKLEERKKQLKKEVKHGRNTRRSGQSSKDN
jgi:hypothetical protein